MLRNIHGDYWSHILMNKDQIGTESAEIIYS